MGLGTLYPSLALLSVCVAVIVWTHRRDRRKAGKTLTQNS